MAGAVVAVGLLGAGCSSHPPKSTPATPSPAASPAPSAGAEQAALVAYRGFWFAFVDASKTSDPDAPDLRRFASGNALKLVVSALVGRREQGKVVLGDVRLDPKVTATSPSPAAAEVTVLDCVDATNWLEYKANGGGLWDDKPGGKHRNTATVKVANGEWRVDSFTLEGTGTC